MLCGCIDESWFFGSVQHPAQRRKRWGSGGLRNSVKRSALRLVSPRSIGWKSNSGGENITTKDKNQKKSSPSTSTTVTKKRMRFPKWSRSKSQSPTNQEQPSFKHLTVKVPQGTPPGSSLNVRIPKENRIVVVKVPWGNVKRFKVAYAPQQPSSSSPKATVVAVPPSSSKQEKEGETTPVTNGGNSNARSTPNPKTNNDSNRDAAADILPVVASSALVGTEALTYLHFVDPEES